MFNRIFIAHDENNRMHNMIEAAMAAAHHFADVEDWELEAEVDAYLTQGVKALDIYPLVNLHPLDKEIQLAGQPIVRDMILDNIRNNKPVDGTGPVEFKVPHDRIQEYYDECCQRICALDDDELEKFIELRQRSFGERQAQMN